MAFIEESIEKDTEITNQFIRELHQLTLADLTDEGDKTPGAYREWNVHISLSHHLPPEHYLVQGYIDELLNIINTVEQSKYDLLKTAIAHHRFAWVHPFGNGNGRVVRLLTYAMMIKYGFNMKEGKLINPTTVFCNDRDYYYKKLAEADKGDDKSLLSWCDYVLSGVLSEVTKINKLLNFDYLHENILTPTIEYGADRGYLNEIEVNILKIGMKEQSFKSTDLNQIFSELSSRQRTHQIAKMRDAGLIKPLKENGRRYYINFMNNFLMRGLIKTLEQEKFIPAIDK